jgi:hypothetical protein
MLSLQQAIKVILYGPKQDCLMLTSPPGTGKSNAVVYAAQIMGSHYLPVYAATMEAVDARGLPYVESANGHKITGWAAPSFLPLESELEKYNGRDVLVNFDDWPQAPPPVMRATVRSIYGDGSERKIGDFPIYRNVRFVATGNREQDRAGANRVESYVGDRITFLDIEPDVDEWVTGAISGFAKPEPDPEYPAKRAAIERAIGHGIPDELIAYVKWSKQVYDFSTDNRSQFTPRSIERLGRFMRAFDAMGVNGAILHEVASGTIGDAQAVKFMAFHNLRADLPDTDAILRGENVPLPPRTEILYILCTAIIRAGKKEHCAAVAKLIDKLAHTETDHGMKVGVEVSAYLFKECLHGSAQELRGVRSIPSMMKWLQEHGKYFG